MDSYVKAGNAYTGWLSDTQYGIWYYFREGQYRNGWVQSGSNWYYLDHGKMVTDELTYEINGAVYGFDNSGVMCTGRKKYTITMLNGTIALMEKCCMIAGIRQERMNIPNLIEAECG